MGLEAKQPKDVVDALDRVFSSARNLHLFITFPLRSPKPTLTGQVTQNLSGPEKVGKESFPIQHVNALKAEAGTSLIYSVRSTRVQIT